MKCPIVEESLYCNFIKATKVAYKSLIQICSSSFDNLQVSLDLKRVFGVCNCIFLFFQFRNQYDNDVTVWSPQVNKFCCPGNE